MDLMVSNAIEYSVNKTKTIDETDKSVVPNLRNGEINEVLDKMPVSESDSIQTVSWLEICRICAKTSDHIVPIFEGVGAEHEILKIIHKHLPIQVEETDTLPIQLCYHCASTLISWNELLENCLDVQNHLGLMQAELEQKKDEEESSVQCDEEMKEESSEEKSLMETIEGKYTVINDSSISPESSSEELLDEAMKTERCEIVRAACPIKCPNQNYSKETPIKSESQVPEVPRNQKSTVIVDLDSWEPEDCDPEPSEEPVSKRKRVNNQTPLECQICNKTLRDRRTLEVHLRIHTGEKPYTCYVCGKQYTQSGSYYYHMKHVHGGVKEHECDECGRKFALKPSLRDHERTHDGKRPLVCPICNKTFKTKASLHVHGRMHKKEQYSCNFCDKSFRWRQQLVTHLSLAHALEKEFPCDLCDKAFTAKYDLTRHKLIHSEEKPFKCEKCGAKFGQKRYLKNHTTRHKECGSQVS